MKRLVLCLGLLIICCPLMLVSANILEIAETGTIAEIQQAIKAGADVNAKG